MSRRGPVSDSDHSQCHGRGLRVSLPWRDHSLAGITVREGSLPGRDQTIHGFPRPLMLRQGPVSDSDHSQCHERGLRVANTSPGRDHSLTGSLSGRDQAIHGSPRSLLSRRGPVSDSHHSQCHGRGLRVANTSRVCLRGIIPWKGSLPGRNNISRVSLGGTMQYTGPHDSPLV